MCWIGGITKYKTTIVKIKKFYDPIENTDFVGLFQNNMQQFVYVTYFEESQKANI